MPALLTSTSGLAQLVDGLPHHPHDLVLLGDVGADQDVARAVLLHTPGARVDLLLGLGCLVGRAQVVDGDVGAMLGEAHGDRWPMPEVPPVTRTFLPSSPRMPSARGTGFLWVLMAHPSAPRARRYAPRCAWRR
jgi:hypothetical protein